MLASWRETSEYATKGVGVMSQDRTGTRTETRTGERAARRLPPGSRLPGLVQNVQWLRDPVGFVRRGHERYGDVFRVRMVGAPGLVYVAGADLARQVFATDRDVGRAGAARKDFLEPVVGSNSLLCLDGEEWLRQRRLLGSAFHGKRIERYRDEIATIAARHVRSWPVGEPFGLRPRMQAITLEVILRVVFGVRDDERVERLRELLPRLMASADSVSSVIFMLPAPVWRSMERLVAQVPGNPVARFVARQRAVDGLLYDEISRRRAAEDVAERTDILSVLLRARDDDGKGLSDGELRDSLLTLLLAGHETTATALSWVFERLVRHPAVLERVADTEADGYEDYLDAVIKETLRTRPVVPDMPRVLTEPLQLGGYHVPAGWWVTPAVALVHGSDVEYAEPDSFRPERFLASGALLHAPSHAWIPFGGGRRQCLGSHFALMEMQAIIPRVLARLRLRAADDDRGSEAPRVVNVTLVPERDCRVVAERAPLAALHGNPDTGIDKGLDKGTVSPPR